MSRWRFRCCSRRWPRCVARWSGGCRRRPTRRARSERVHRDRRVGRRTSTGGEVYFQTPGRAAVRHPARAGHGRVRRPAARCTRRRQRDRAGSRSVRQRGSAGHRQSAVREAHRRRRAGACRSATRSSSPISSARSADGPVDVVRQGNSARAQWMVIARDGYRYRTARPPACRTASRIPTTSSSATRATSSAVGAKNMFPVFTVARRADLQDVDVQRRRNRL